MEHVGALLAVMKGSFFTLEDLSLERDLVEFLLSFLLGQLALVSEDVDVVLVHALFNFSLGLKQVSVGIELLLFDLQQLRLDFVYLVRVEDVFIDE